MANCFTKCSKHPRCTTLKDHKLFSPETYRPLRPKDPILTKEHIEYGLWYPDPHKPSMLDQIEKPKKVTCPDGLPRIREKLPDSAFSHTLDTITRIDFQKPVYPDGFKNEIRREKPFQIARGAFPGIRTNMTTHEEIRKNYLDRTAKHEKNFYQQRMLEKEKEEEMKPNN